MPAPSYNRRGQFASLRLKPSAMILLVVPRQQVGAKIRMEIPPDRMNVIGVILNVVVFDQERRPLNPIVMRLTLFEPTGPGQENTSQASRADSVQSRCRDIRCVPQGIFTQKSHQNVLLLLTQLAGLKS